MSAIDAIRRDHDALISIRHDLHAHPELGMEEHRTAEIVAAKLASWGIEVHRGVGKTGVVGVLRGRPGNRAVGLRADMDALPMTEMTGLDFASTVPGKMHACGHDGHTTMLLGAAKYLAETKQFSGTVNFIFQPGRRGVAVRWRCWRMGCSSDSRATPSMGCITGRGWTSAPTQFGRGR